VWESGELKLENLIYCYEADKEIERILETEHAVAGDFKNVSGVGTSPSQLSLLTLCIQGMKGSRHS
jgi:hypothetical protein